MAGLGQHVENFESNVKHNNAFFSVSIRLKTTLSEVSLVEKQYVTVKITFRLRVCAIFLASTTCENTGKKFWLRPLATIYQITFKKDFLPRFFFQDFLSKLSIFLYDFLSNTDKTYKVSRQLLIILKKVTCTRKENKFILTLVCWVLWILEINSFEISRNQIFLLGI